MVIQGSMLGNTTDEFSLPPAARTAPFSALKNQGPRKEVFWPVSPSLISLHVSHVISNSILPCSYGRGPKAMTIAYAVWLGNFSKVTSIVFSRTVTEKTFLNQCYKEGLGMRAQQNPYDLLGEDNSAYCLCLFQLLRMLT